MQGMLTIWTDIDVTAEQDFNDWYNLEHLHERASVPGFFNARRYRALTGDPPYMALYDTESASVLTSDAYKQILVDATPWTDRIMPSFRNTIRCVSDQVYQWGQGWGQIAISVRFALEPADIDAAQNALIDTIIPSITNQPGVVGVFLMRPVPSDGGPIPAGAADGQAPVSLFLNIACIDNSAADRLLDTQLNTATLEAVSIPSKAATFGVYQFISGVDSAVIARDT